MLPTLLCTLVAYAVTNSLSLGIFDVMTDMRNLPYLPVLKSVEQYQMEAKDIMNRNFLFLVENSTLGEAYIIAHQLGSWAVAIPVLTDNR